MKNLILLLSLVLLAGCGMVRGHDEPPYVDPNATGIQKLELVREERTYGSSVVYKLTTTNKFKYELLTFKLTSNFSTGETTLEELDIECGSHKTYQDSWPGNRMYNLVPDDPAKENKTVVGYGASSVPAGSQNGFLQRSLGYTENHYYMNDYKGTPPTVIGATLTRCNLN